MNSLHLYQIEIKCAKLNWNVCGNETNCKNWFIKAFEKRDFRKRRDLSQ